ncbi:outer membrane receptor protein involved in Fe transport [Maribacter spongiicola]|uniref:Outer membrane receptor protein involved in Fe transport n=1 Tax=Maribacter spongiicola TaxID=1206753 RepID=A0A4R7K2Y6_9FLAO|nr:outer membrane beta-barrel family protein [Maribacter spongiicola]TDT44866.1 outer membrane receptor protein involved in Fe transport [Maribacter spongiicola]
MRQLFPLLLLLALSFNYTYSQRPGGDRERGPITISGKVLDKDDNLPLEYATLVLQSVNNPDQITGGITDIDGNFKVEASPGKYNISIEYISYKTFKLPNQTLTENKDLGTVRLALDVAQLEAVEVVGEKTTVEVRLDKKIYNIGKDLTNSGATISDALDNIPSVTVDADGAVALRGNGNVRILINGRPSALAGFGSTDALQQLPADAIEKVEVITSPSARYDAEGTAGILNIVLKKEKTRGINGTINTTVGFPDAASLTANMNLRKEKYNVFTTLGYSYRTPPGNGFADNIYLGDESVFDRIIEDRDINRMNSGFNLNLGMEYFLTETSSVTASAFGRTNNGEDITEIVSTNFVGNDINRITQRIEDEQEEEKSAQFSLNYNNDFNTEGHKLTVDLQLSYNEEFKPTPINEQETITNTGFDGARLNIEELELQNEYLAQVDYILPIGDAQFEAGYRGNWEQSDTDFYLEDFNFDTGAFVPNLGLINRFVFNQNVNSFYTQYGNKLGDFSFLAGLRLENTQLKGEIVGADIEQLQEIIGEGIEVNFDKNYLGLFPTLNLIYELAENENISIGYNRRINRPRGRFINPFPSQSSRTNIFQGNPDLDPAFANAFDLGYLKRWDKLTLTSSVYYQKETNSFERIQEETGQITTDGIVVIRSIPINLATNERVGAELGLLYNPTKWLRLNGSFNFFEFNSDGEFNGINFGARNTSWFSRFSSKVTLPSKIEWQTNAFYRGPTNNAQTVNEGIFSLNLAFSKDILKEKGTLALNVSDLLNSRRRISSTQTPFFTSESEFQWRERQITLSFVYRLNQKKQRREREGERNDDGGDDEYGS